jgi:hypothetical protein
MEFDDPAVANVCTAVVIPIPVPFSHDMHMSEEFAPLLAVSFPGWHVVQLDDASVSL